MQDGEFVDRVMLGYDQEVGGIGWFGVGVRVWVSAGWMNAWVAGTWGVVS